MSKRKKRGNFLSQKSNKRVCCILGKSSLVKNGRQRAGPACGPIVFDTRLYSGAFAVRLPAWKLVAFFLFSSFFFFGLDVVLSSWRELWEEDNKNNFAPDFSRHWILSISKEALNKTKLNWRRIKNEQKFETGLSPMARYTRMEYIKILELMPIEPTLFKVAILLSKPNRRTFIIERARTNFFFLLRRRRRYRLCIFLGFLRSFRLPTKEKQHQQPPVKSPRKNNNNLMR